MSALFVQALGMIAFLVWTQHFTSVYGAAVAGGGAILLTLRYLHYIDVGLAPNAITCYDMLLATNEFKNWHFCTNVHPRTVGSIACSEGMRT